MSEGAIGFPFGSSGPMRFSLVLPGVLIYSRFRPIWPDQKLKIGQQLVGWFDEQA